MPAAATFQRVQFALLKVTATSSIFLSFCYEACKVYLESNLVGGFEEEQQASKQANWTNKIHSCSHDRNKVYGVKVPMLGNFVT